MSLKERLDFFHSRYVQTQEQSVHHAKDGGIGADTERDGQDRNEAEARIAAKSPEDASKVLRQDFPGHG